MPCSPMSSPSSSSDSVTRMPPLSAPRIDQRMKEVTIENNAKASTPTSCRPSCPNPWPVSKPLSVLNKPTARVPQMPQVPCTEKAPTGSSMRRESMNPTDQTTRAPAMNPTTQAAGIEKPSQPAVTPTRPARMPLMVIVRSGLPPVNWLIKVPEMPPAAPPRVVVTAM